MLPTLQYSNIVEVYNYDKEGKPLLFIRSENINIIKTEKELQDLIYFVIEFLIRKTERCGKAKSSCVYDFRGFKMSMNTTFAWNAFQFMCQMC